MKRILAVPALALALLLPAHALAADAVARLAALLGAASTLQAHFEQTVTGANGVDAGQTRGTMTVSRPDLFRWAVEKPFEQLIVADGRQVWVYDPDLAQAVVRPFDRQLADTPALLFSGDAERIARSFEVKVLGEQGDDLRFELLPRGESALFESLRVSFRGGRLASMFLLDSLGQRTEIRFSQVVLNKPVPAGSFQFTPPAGTDVIHETQ